MFKILIIGNGFIANFLANYLSDDFYVSHFKDKILISAFDNNNLAHCLDVYNKYQCQNTSKPDVIINCAGKTGKPNIDSLESDKTNTYLNNTVLPLLLADYCELNNIKLIHISSGCYWKDYNKRYTEEDLANPPSYYGKTKYAADLLLKNLSHVLTLRIRMPISAQPDPRNLITKILSYSKIIDMPNSVTFLDDLGDCIIWAISNDKSGLYNCTSPESISAAEIARMYQKYRPEHEFSVISSEELDAMTKAPRSNCLLDTSKLEIEGFTCESAPDKLKTIMPLYINNLK